MTRRKNRRPHGGPKKSTGAQAAPKEEWIDRDDDLQMKNDLLERYYKAQHIVPDEEWDDLIAALRRPLPSTFRIAGGRQTAQDLQKAMMEIHVPHLKTSTFEGEPLPVPSQIPWYPEGLAWQINMARKELRRSQEYKRFHNFLVYETEIGNITRQEAVSMLPPLFLDVQPHHNVIDMCAAPGSKTSQLIEAFLVDESKIPSGLLIANDTDHKRTHLLVHHTARLPCPALMVTNLDASIYPAVKIPTAAAAAMGMKLRKGNQQQIYFDRILCDVPCSGDGTLRKNVGIWKTWHAMDGNGLHGLQIRILQRAMRMLTSEGRIVYSTCSLNPVENEAVLAAALNSIPGFEIIDVPDVLPELVRRPGMTSWCPSPEREGNTPFSTYDEYMASLPSDDDRATTKMLPTHWPPASVANLHLERCLRIYPHLQDSGGFFLAVLQRTPRAQSAAGSSTAGTPALVNLPETKRPPSTDLESAVSKKAKTILDEARIDHDEAVKAELLDVEDVDPYQPTKPLVFKEQPYYFVSPDEPALQSCIANLGISSEFPASNLFMRNPPTEPVRTLYLVNDLVKTIIQNNDYSRIRLVSAGVKVFGKAEGQKGASGTTRPTLRVLSDGLQIVLPYMQPNLLLVTDMAALRTCLESYHPFVSQFTGSFRSALEQKAFGSHIVCFKADSLENKTITHDLYLPLWKSEVSISLMLDKNAKSALSLRVFGDNVTAAGKKSVQVAQEPAATAPEFAIIDAESETIKDEPEDPGM